MGETIHYGDKLKAILEKFSRPDYVITNNCDIENLVSHLSKLSREELDTTCYEWVKKILGDEDFFRKSVSNSVKTFIFRLVALLSNEEIFLIRFYFRGIIDFMFGYMSSDAHHNHSLKLAYIKILKIMCQHTKTMDWMLKNKICRYALKLFKENNISHITKATVDFIVTLVWKLNNIGDEPNCIIVLDEIIQPICEHPWKDLKVVSSDLGDEMDRLLSPVFILLTELLGYPKSFGKGSIVARYLNGETSVVWFVWNLYFMCHNENLLRNLSKTNFVGVISSVNMFKKDEDMHDDDVVKINLFYLNLVNVLIVKRKVDIILEFCMFCHRYLNSVFDCIPKESGNYYKLESIQKQFIIMPILAILITVKNPKNNDQEILQLFVHKLFSISYEQFTRISYSFLDLVRDDGNPEIIAIKSIHNLMSIKDTITVNEANIIFQALFYKLKDFLPTTGMEMSNSSGQYNETLESAQSMRMLCTILDALYWIIDKYEISWHESVEVISVYQIITNLMTMRTLSTDGVVKTLRLTKLTIDKFLLPNLALLIDSPNESNMNQIGKNIYAKLHDLSWEIRDSAFEVLLTCTTIALIKYPPLQNQIFDHNLASVTVTMALNDPESYVRASALRCLNAMTNIQIIWNQCLDAFPNLLVIMMKLIHNETEGLVRKEVVSVLNSVYEHHNIPGHLHEHLLQSMSHAAMGDLYWEVQLAALKFWKLFINHLLTNQGMIDGNFPSVTFSKETRKIVTLNDYEIVKRLKKVLKELSISGCLGVLIYNLGSDVDLKIMEFSYSIVEYLKIYLDKYKVQYNISDSPMDVAHSETMNNDLVNNDFSIKNEMDDSALSFVDKERSKTIIESILNANDITLLANAYRNQLTVKSEPEDGYIDMHSFRNENSKKLVVDPEEFIKMINDTDYSQLLEAKKLWTSGNSNLPSLLDDILGECNDKNINDMGCC